MGLSFDLNCDMGESFGNYTLPGIELMPFITSANIACGFHGGDPHHIRQTVQSAIANNIRIGAHPGYPDLQGFGRRKMDIHEDELKSIVLYQVSALKGIVEAYGGDLSYVKPHGALYHACANNVKDARAVLNAIRQLDLKLAIMGLPKSSIHRLCLECDHPFILEGFVDRKYQSDGNLRSRSYTDAVIQDSAEAAAQVSRVINDHQVETVDNKIIELKVDSLCLHGDNPKAMEIAQYLHQQFSV